MPRTDFVKTDFAQFYSTAEDKPIDDINESHYVAGVIEGNDADELLLWRFGSDKSISLGKTVSKIRWHIVRSNHVFASCIDGTVHAWVNQGGNWTKQWTLKPSEDLESRVQDCNAAKGLLAVSVLTPISSVYILDRNTGTQLTQVTPAGTNANHVVFSFAFSSDGDSFALGTNHKVLVGNLENPTLVRELPHPESILCLKFSRDGKILFTGCGDHRLRKWDLETCELLASFEFHKAPIASIALSSDERNLVSMDFDGTAMIWNLLVDQPLMAIASHENPLQISENSDDRWLVRQRGTAVIADRVDRAAEK